MSILVRFLITQVVWNAIEGPNWTEQHQKRKPEAQDDHLLLVYVSIPCLALLSSHARYGL